MKKIFIAIIFVLSFSTAPAFAATKKAATPPAKPAYKAVAPTGYAPIDWAKAPGVASFFKTPTDNGALDFITRINLRNNQINFVVSPDVVVEPANPNPTPVDPAAAAAADDISTFPNLSFKRLGAEASKIIDPSIKFIWDAPFFNMGAVMSDLSMAVKYTIGSTTMVSSGTRSAADMALPRRMLLIDNKAGKAAIADFDSATFTSPKSGDQALEGFSPVVPKADSAGGAASRLFLGVSNDGQELNIYCSQSATVKEASDALAAAGVSVDHQLEADGGGSAACGYNLPGQFFVEPTRTLPLLMGAKTILLRGKVTGDSLNVRSGPGTKYPIITKLVKGAAVVAYGELSGWYRIGDGQWAIKSLIK